MLTVKLKNGREKSVRNFHPWLFSGAIGKVEGRPSPGEIVRIADSGNNFLAYGYYNHKPQITVRILEWAETAIIDDTWWYDKIAESIARRNKLASEKSTDSYRLVHAECDRLPGLIVDKYSDRIVVQSSTAGVDRAKDAIVKSLVELLSPACIFERSDMETRKLEGLKESSGLLYGDKMPEELIIRENGLKFAVDIASGQKTGFYLDQRANRRKVAEHVAGLDILDCFSHTGAFSVYALKAEARSVTLLDSSKASLALARRNIELNDFTGDRADYIAGDAFEILRRFREQGRKFDMVILDPPKFAASRSNLKKALTGYKDINMLGIDLLKPGGYLASYSCSSAVDYETLKLVLFWAAIDTGRILQIHHDFSQGDDHPRLASFPEGTYLKGFGCRAL